MRTIVTLDIGSSYIKSAIFEIKSPKAVSLLQEARKSHDAGLLFEDPSQYTEEIQGDIIQLLQSVVAQFRPVALGISAYRESVVVLDRSGNVSACGSNQNIDAGRRAIDRSSGKSDSVVCSLPTWLVWKWTGKLYATPSDQFAIRQLQNAAPGQELWPMPQVVPVGCCIALTEILGQGIPVFLGGTDEQLAHLGVGLGSNCDLGISTGTFWTFSWRHDDVTEDPRIRVIPRIPPYPPTASLIGYRWGSVLYAARKSQGTPVLPSSGIPEWAFGDAVRLWHDGRPLSDLASAVKNDISMVPSIIGPEAPAIRRVVAYGGGVKWLPDARQAITDAFAEMEVEFMTQDATLQGLAFLGSTASFD